LYQKLKIMEVVESLIKFLKSKGTTEERQAPDGFCPNCWGRSEYGGKFFDQIKQEDLNVNSKDSNVGWVQAYANKNLMGIALKRKGNGEELICEGCKASYQDETKSD